MTATIPTAPARRHPERLPRVAPTIAVTGIRLVPAGPALWRVLDHSGRAIGHLQAVLKTEGIAWRARRFHRVSRDLRDLGDFWSPGDAVDCLRFAR
ncbi:hypothetical protein [Microbacterium immunditiarum]|uniref:DNA mismatch repair protein n=1 Tax=Microbacterium immunditiarum TaxID=337480 RepID=A0A7Y9GPL2_9MICO|nr:hypothetical protein [Microbacterium immunditiarum]NYE20187.1 hypothetical protein [Microbacterium immunditiarum]